MNPGNFKLFGHIGPLRMMRQSRFRARTSSANWTKTDQLTAEKEHEYARRKGFGWSMILSCSSGQFVVVSCA
ncbi:hypothetical protein B0H21DRAFT_753444 [Amylocystis lapponica]|nr:hypothetical protein B0H21DRAFT_753444 [Amylocystis lapponica]